MNKELAKAGVKKSVAPASEMANKPSGMANKPSGMSNRTKFRLTCTVLNVIAIAATLAIVKPKMFKDTCSGAMNCVKKTIKTITNEVKSWQQEK